MAKWDKEYLGLCKKILTEGKEVDNRTGINTIKIPSHHFHFDLQEEFPILTTKQLFIRQAVLEMLWIYQAKSNDVRWLQERNVHIWDDMNLYTLTHAEDAPFEIVYERDGKEYTVEVEPRVLDESGSKLLGVVSGEIEKPGILGTMQYGFYQLEYWVHYTVDCLRMIVTGQAGLRDLSGPVGIVNVVNDVYETKQADICRQCNWHFATAF